MLSFRRTLGLAAVAVLTSPAFSAYTLQDDYQPSKFFSMFSFWTDADPTHGYVDYVNQQSASSAGLIQSNSDSIYMGVDVRHVYTCIQPSRPRLTAK